MSVRTGQHACAGTEEWLAQMLAAERANVMDFLKERHRKVMSEFRSAAGNSPEQQSPKREAPSADIGVADSKSTTARFVLPGCPEELAASGSERADTHQETPLSPTLSTASKLRSVSRKLTDVKKSLGVSSAQLDDDEESTEEQSWTHKLVTGPWFEGVVSAIIMANVVVMAAQVQYTGLEIGYLLDYRWHNAIAAETWRNADVVFDVFDYTFGIIYILELVAKIRAFGRSWVKDAWNWFDALIVGFWLMEKPFKDVLVLPADATLLRTARLFKLLRLVKVIRTLHGFDSLYLLVTTLKGSLQILGWSCILLLVLQTLMAFGIFFVLNETYFLNASYPLDERQKVFEYFGSFSRSMLSMFEMTLANWPPVCRLLVENVNEWFMLFFLAHKLTIGFAVIGVINGVFMQETFKAASSDDSIMMRQKEREVKTYTEKMARLFRAADDSGDGEIDVHEFCKVMGDREIVMWLNSMEIPVRDAESLFTLMDSNGRGTLTLDTMTKSALKIRGAAKSVDVLAMKKQLDGIQTSLAHALGGRGFLT